VLNRQPPSEVILPAASASCPLCSRWPASMWPAWHISPDVALVMSSCNADDEELLLRPPCGAAASPQQRLHRWVLGHQAASQVVEKLSADVTLEMIRQRQLEPGSVWLGPSTCADSHLSKRIEQQQRSACWRARVSCIVRCSMHCAHSCEARTLEVVRKTRSALRNIYLTFSVPGFLWRFRRGLGQLVSQRLVICRGQPSMVASVWRESLYSPLPHC
jgi:hypothetical protein